MDAFLNLHTSVLDLISVVNTVVVDNRVLKKRIDKLCCNNSRSNEALVVNVGVSDASDGLKLKSAEDDNVVCSPSIDPPRRTRDKKLANREVETVRNPIRRPLAVEENPLWARKQNLPPSLSLARFCSL